MMMGMLLLLALSINSSAAETAKADDISKVEANRKEKLRQARLRKVAEAFTVYVDNSEKQQAKLVSEPIFRWANPQRETIGGAIFLWTHQGRPHATIGLWTYDDTAATDSHELQSLSESPFASQGPTPWFPRTAGIDFKRFAKDQQVATSKARRLVQMLAAGPQILFGTPQSGTSREEKLRLLPTPVYRYSEMPEDVTDGAMFSFASGTDPEVFLILEARRVGGKSTWHYAFANQTSGSTDASFRGKVAWTNKASRIRSSWSTGAPEFD